MKYLDEFRDASLAKALVSEIQNLATKRWVIMDVCGGQTHSLLRHGIEESLEDSIELIHGPGCPVCVTPIEAIDLAQELAILTNVVLTSFGDMMRVPGSRDSLIGTRSRGGNIRAVYTPLDAVKLAQQMPDRQIVFFAVGFETTAPATALAVLQADRLGINNFSLIVAHVRVLPAMEALMLSPDSRVQGFLGAGHVCTVTGIEDYEPFVRRFRVPVAITGFEPIDLLYGIREMVRQLETGRSELINSYSRSVRTTGNESAQNAVNEVYEVVDAAWRGFGVIGQGGLRLNRKYRHFDAQRRFAIISNSADVDCHCRLSLSESSDAPRSFAEQKATLGSADTLPIVDEHRCRSADVLSGRIKPTACPEFGKLCRPEQPLGAPMVSSEGACAAYFRYHST